MLFRSVAVLLLRMILYAPIIGIGGVLKVTNTKTGMGWIIGIAVGSIMLLVGVLMSVTMPKFKKMQTLVDRLNLVSREILTGVPVIRAFSREKFEEKRFAGANEDLMRTQLFTSRVMSMMMPAMMLIMNCITVMIVWFGAKGVDLGNLQVGDMMAFITYTMQIVMAFLMITMVSVMLPPMAIFFPLFTLLEDLGYLPRIAFHMDRSFKRCRACGKQCLTMAMGFGCNAAGVIGCRIIDSPRERLIAILTNSLVPCNGRFPTLITLITLFFLTGIQGTFSGSLVAALLLTAAILAGICATLGCSWVLSHTFLKGIPSAFTLELPPYRRPQIGKILVRSILDRTLFVLGRAAAIAAPAGLVIWILANTAVGGQSLLLHLTGFFDPLGRLMGLDGVILMAFLLGFPANEIVVPIMLMTYLQSGMLVEMTDSAALLTLLTANGWTWKTALCMLIFCLFHWPCSTTCLTIKKETGSLKWTAVGFLLPTVLGVFFCIGVNVIALCLGAA